MVKDPYSCPNKQASRLKIWDEMVKFRSPEATNALILPGPKPYELNVLLSKGYQPKNIFLVEKNSATLANLSRVQKEGYPPPKNRLRMWLGNAGEVLERRGVHIHVAHLDFQENCFSHQVWMIRQQIHQFVRSGVMASRSLIAVTWLRSREYDPTQIESEGYTVGVQSVDPGSKSAKAFYEAMSERDKGRLRTILDAIANPALRVGVVKLDHYQNTRTRGHMFWSIFQVSKK